MTRRGALYALVIAALACLAVSGTVHPYIAPLCIGWLFLQRFLDRRNVRVPEGAVAMLHVWLGTIFLWFALIGRQGTNADLLDLLLAFGAPFLVLKVAAPQTRFNEAVTMMSCILIVLGSAAAAPGLRPLFSLVLFLGTACVALPALIRREPTPDDGVSFRVLESPGEWRYASVVAGLLLAAVGLVLGGLLYLFVPRLAPESGDALEEQALDIQARRSRTRGVSGFARRMKIGDIGSIKRDNRVAFEAQCRLRGQPYAVTLARNSMLLMRMRAWDTYDPVKAEWTRRLGKLKPIGRDGVLRREESPRDWPVDWSIRSVGYGGRTLLHPPRAGRIRTPGVRVLRGPAGSLVAEEPVREYGIEAGEPISTRSQRMRLRAAEPTAALLKVPDALVADLRKHTPSARGLSVWQKVEAINRYFTQQQFRYTLQLPPSLPAGVDPVIAFLDRREGHCELYAAAACLMLRLSGVPARVAGGMRMTRDRKTPGRGRYLARFSNAHAWVEIQCRNAGWVAVDFTPADRRAVQPTPPEGSGADENAAQLAIGGRGEAEAEGPPLLDWSDPFTFSRADQARFRQRVWASFDGRLLPWFAGTLMAWALFVFVRSRWRRRRASPLRIRAPDGVARRTLAFYARWLKQCASRGHHRRRHQTPREFLATLPAELRTDGEAITARFEALRYQ